MYLPAVVLGIFELPLILQLVSSPLISSSEGTNLFMFPASGGRWR